MVVVQEGEGTSTQEEGLWDPNLDSPSFLEKVLLPIKTKEKLSDLEKDHLVEQAVRQLGQALATNCLAISQLREWKGSAEKKSHEVTELLQQVGGLKQETSKLHEELQRSQQEAKALLTKKSMEALELFDKNVRLQAEVERLKEELAQKDEELVPKGEELVKEREALTDNAANSYMAAFEDVVAQASRIYLGMDFSQLVLGKTVVDG